MVWNTLLWMRSADSSTLFSFGDCNIFPSLKWVRDSVVIEPWNRDFNCSALREQLQRHIIPELYCNGTDNGTVADLGTGNQLAPGAWAGVGIGAAAAVFGLVWALVYFWRKSRRTSNAAPEKPKPEPTAPCLDGNAIQEAEGDGVFPERAFHVSYSEMDAVRPPTEFNAVRSPVEIG